MKVGVRVFLALGSNQGDRIANIDAAIKAISQLESTKLVACSSLYHNAAVGEVEQEDFINAAVEISSSLSAQSLLRQVQVIEKSLGRVREAYWGPRTIDIDLLLYGNELIAEENLVVPHPLIKERDFVLLPLLELDPSLAMPDGMVLADVIKQQHLVSSVERLNQREFRLAQRLV